jgi:hypothetical protein
MGSDFNKIWYEVFTNKWAIYCNLFVAGLIFWPFILDF